MSNFKCHTCGFMNIDCGKAGYKTDREIELEQEINKLKTIIDRTKVNGNYPDRISKLKSRIVALAKENEKLKTQFEAIEEYATKKEKEIGLIKSMSARRKLIKEFKQTGFSPISILLLVFFYI